MRNPYESESSEIAQSAIEAIGACQTHAEETGIEIIAFALESVRADVLAMVKASVERERLFKSFIDLIADSLGANQTDWRNQWQTFVENGGVRHDK